jgi:hypothetical protein
MRYLFKPEIDLLLAQNQYKLTVCREWMSDRNPGFDTWGIYFMVKG